MTIHELSRLLANLIREATVVAYNADGTVIVQSGGLVSQPLRFFQPAAGTINTHRPLSVGENCLVFSPSGEFGNGYVFGGLPTGNAPSPSYSPDQHITHYPDGVVIAYNLSSKTLTAKGIATADIEASDQIKLKAPKIILDGIVEATKAVNAGGVINANAGLAAADSSGSGAVVEISVPVKFKNTVTSEEVIQDGHGHLAPAGGGMTGEPQ